MLKYEAIWTAETGFTYLRNNNKRETKPHSSGEILFIHLYGKCIPENKKPTLLSAMLYFSWPFVDRH